MSETVSGSASQDTIEALYRHLLAGVPSSAHATILERDGERISLQVGRSTEAIVSVTVHDRAIPSFAVTYPVRRTHDDREATSECTLVDVRTEGVVWIVRKVYRFGFVPPEGFRKEQRNRGRRAAQPGATDNPDDLQ